MDHRVRFNKAPLIETIFQIQFPEILRISSEVPVQFQELIRNDYPNFSQQIVTNTVQKQGENPQVLPPLKSYEFINRNGDTKIGLTNTFVAVSSLNYTKWEDFKMICKDAVDKAISVYQPGVIQRVGLRYKDLICRSKWNMQDKRWNELIKSEYLGALAEVDEKLIPRYVLDYEIFNPETEIVEHNHRELVLQRDNLEKSLLIDNDYYKIGFFGCDDIWAMADGLHKQSGAFIRNVFTPTLEEAMEPVEL